MARHAQPLPNWAQGDVRPYSQRRKPRPGPTPVGTAYGVPFGQLDAGVLAAVLADPQVAGLRFTPWRLLILEGAAPGERPGLLLNPDAPLLRVEACPGSPFCPQATVATRDLASALATRLTGSLHVSGCSKGCARSRRADVVVTGRAGRFDVAFDARAADPPQAAGLLAEQVLALVETR